MARAVQLERQRLRHRAHARPAPRSARVLIGDTNPEIPGREIVVSQVNGAHAGAGVHVFAGLAQGDLRQLGSWRLFPRRTLNPEAVEVALADALGSHPGLELLISTPAGRLYIFDAAGGRRRLLRALDPFEDRPRATAARFAVGDLLPGYGGLEIAIADDGSVGDGLVRILNPESNRVVAEFSAFARGDAPAGVALWAGDVHPAVGCELIVGQGSAGPKLRVVSMANWVSRTLANVPNSAGRSSSLRHHLAIADFDPTSPGKEVAVAQADALARVQIFSFDATGAHVRGSASAGASGEVVDVFAAD